MNLKLIFAITASIIGVICFIPYIADIFKGKTKPHSYSWLIWTILQVVGAIVMFNAGAGVGVTSLSIGAFLCFFVLILSLFYGTKNIKTFDTICLIGAFIAIGVYLFFHSAPLSILIVTITDVIGYLPTIRKSYFEPNTETSSTYIISTISHVLSVLALSNFSFTTSIYLLSLVVTNGVCGAVILIRRKNKVI